MAPLDRSVGQVTPPVVLDAVVEVAMAVLVGMNGVTVIGVLVSGMEVGGINGVTVIEVLVSGIEVDERNGVTVIGVLVRGREAGMLDIVGLPAEDSPPLLKPAIWIFTFVQFPVLAAESAYTL